MSRLGSNYFTSCKTCGGMGHTASNCSLKDHYHLQAVKAVMAGKATPDDMREALRTPNRVSAR